MHEKEIKKNESDNYVILIENDNENSLKSNYPLNYNKKKIIKI